MDDVINTKECLNCGEDLVNLPKKRKKIFCNNTCRSNYWQKSDRLEKAGKTTEQIVSILSKIAKNNRSENKKKIETERNEPSQVSKKYEQNKVLSEMEAEFAKILNEKK